MATKKKAKKKQAKAKKTAGKSAKKLTSKKKPAKKKATKAKAVARKKTSRKAASPGKKKPRGTQSATVVGYPPEKRRLRTGGQSGDLQGLSNAEGADSESVDELLEEGNAFEADVIAGVEEADRSEGREVHTHEVPEDDVPEEYLDKD